MEADSTLRSHFFDPMYFTYYCLGASETMKTEPQIKNEIETNVKGLRRQDLSMIYEMG